MKKTLLITSIIAGLAVAALAQPDTTAGYIMPFMDTNDDGINDNYQNFVRHNPATVANDSTIRLEYKYEYGLGYGYGFSDRDSNGTNDLIDSLPGLNNINPTIKTTRLGGLEVIKRADIRHSKITKPELPIQKEADHFLHEGHCKSDSVYNIYRNMRPIN